MVKKIILLVLVLGLLAGGFFYWRNSQSDVRELNKTLPQGVKVVKSLFGNEYRVVNKIDGYEFKVPKEWRYKINEVRYGPVVEEVFGYPGSTMNIDIESVDDTEGVAINYFETKEPVTNIEKWAGDLLYNVLGFDGELVSDSIDGVDVAKTQENDRIFGQFSYFFKKESGIYMLVSSSGESIKDIIVNGKW